LVIGDQHDLTLDDMARATVLIQHQAAKRVVPRVPGSLIFGPNALIHTTSFSCGALSHVPRANLVPSTEDGRPQPTAFVILSDASGIAAQAYHGAHNRRVPIAGVMATGEGSGGSLSGILTDLTEMDAPPNVILILHAPLPIETLLIEGLDRLVVFACFLRGVRCAKTSASPLPSTPSCDGMALARALGWIVTADPAVLVECAWVHHQQLGTNRLPLFVARFNDEIALLQEVITRTQLRTYRAPVAWRKAHKYQQSGDVLRLTDANTEALANALRPVEPHQRPGAIVMLAENHEHGHDLSCTPPTYAFSTRATGPRQVDGQSLAALAAIQSAATILRPRPVSSDSTELDAWDRSLSVFGGFSGGRFDPLQTKLLLGSFGLMTPVERIVSSASAAGAVARQFGASVCLTLVPAGDGSLPDSLRPITCEGQAAARQAFRDLMHKAALVAPPVPLLGVAVRSPLPEPRQLKCTLFCSFDPPLLQVELREVSPGRFQHFESRRCPLGGEGAAEFARSVALKKGWSAADQQRLADFFLRLSAVALAVQGEVDWIQIADASLPPRGPLQVVECRAARGSRRKRRSAIAARK
jgi:hypothetical protein